MSSAHKNTSNLIEAKYHIKAQKGPNSFQTASALQINKAELQTMCENLRSNIVKFKSVKANHKDIEEISKLIPNATIEEKILEPTLMDFIKLECVLTADQIIHKLLCKVLALVPDISICMYPIKGFAVVTTPMSIKLLQKDGVCVANKFQTGFLTLDQERRIVALHASDPQVKVYTLVGIWVSGLPQPNGENGSADKKKRDSTTMSKEEKQKKLAEKEDAKAKMLNSPLVLAAILRFLFSEDIKSRISPKSSKSENSVPTYLLVNFVGGATLPQFLEFRLKDAEKGANNNWMLLESSHNIARESKNQFKPIKIKISCGLNSLNSDNKSENNEAFTGYKFSTIISTQSDSRPKSQCQKVRKVSAHNEENENPNEKPQSKYKIQKTRNLSLKKTSMKESNDDKNSCNILNTKLKQVPSAKVIINEDSAFKGKPLKILTEHNSHVTLKNGITESAKIAAVHQKPIIDSTKGIRILKTFSQEQPINISNVNNSNGKQTVQIIKAPLNLIQAKTFDINENSTSPRLYDESLDEGIKSKVYVTKQKSPTKVNNMPAPSGDIITPTQTSLNSSLNSNGLQSSKMTGRIRTKLDQSSWAEQFPSYSGNVSLVRTPEYSAMTSASKTSPFYGRIIVEQQKQIQVLQQQLAYLVETMKAMKGENGAMPQVPISRTGGYFNTGNVQNSLNNSTEVNQQARSTLGVYPTTLDLSRTGDSIMGTEHNTSFANVAQMIEKEAQQMAKPQNNNVEIAPAEELKTMSTEQPIKHQINEEPKEIQSEENKILPAQAIISPIPKKLILKPKDSKTTILLNKGSVKIAPNSGKALTDAKKVVSSLQNVSVTDFSNRIMVQSKPVIEKKPTVIVKHGIKSNSIIPTSLSKKDLNCIPRIIVPTDNNDTIESKNEFQLNTIKETNESIPTPKDEQEEKAKIEPIKTEAAKTRNSPLKKQTIKIQKEDSKKKQGSANSKSDWTMEIPKIVYEPDNSPDSK